MPLSSTRGLETLRTRSRSGRPPRHDAHLLSQGSARIVQPNASSRLEVRLLGRPELRLDGVLLPHVAPPRALSLFAFLIANRERRLTRATVAATLWPDEREEGGRANLRRHLHHLNVNLPSPGGVACLSITATTLQWNPQALVWIDVVEFERLAASPGSAAAAAALYGGEFLAGHSDNWALAERERLLATFLDVAYTLAVGARAERDFVQARAYADRILALGEWREDALRVKMAALYEMGDRPGALAAFDTFSKRLGDEMGVDTMPETGGLHEMILAHLPLASESAPATARTAPPIVGRASELERLLAWWQLAAGRTGTTIFLGGEAGAGKSRLLAELARSIEREGGHALFGHARDGEGAPYQPLIDVVRAAAPYLVRGELPDVWLSALAPLVPELLRLHPDLPEIPNIEGGKLRLHEAFARVLESLARRRPVAVVLEDVHSANVDTLDAFEHLARRAGSSRILIVASYRPEEASSEHPLRGLRRKLQQEDRASILELGPLDREAIGEIVRGAAPNAAEPATLADAIYRSSEGNPLFAWQLLQGFLETGTFSSESLAIDQAIAARAARLPPETRRVLDAASLVGDRFTVEELVEIGAWNDGEVFGAVDSLLDLRLFRYTSAPGRDLSFAHRLIRDAIAAHVPAGDRPEAHRRIAAVLERTRDRDFELIAAHHALAGNTRAAYAGYLRAAREALAIFANGDAAGRASRACELASDDRERFDASVVLLDAYRLDTKNPHWERALDETEAVAQRLGDDERFETLRRRCRFLERASRREDQRAAARQLLRVAEATGRAAHRMHAFHQLARVELLRGRLEESARWLEAAVEAAPPEDVAGTARCLALLAFDLFRLGENERATRTLERARAVAGDSADAEIQSELLVADLGRALLMEDATTYRQVGERYLELSSRVGSISGTGHGLSALAQAAYFRGEVAEARERYAQAGDVFERHAMLSDGISNSINWGCLEREVGNFAAAFAFWEEALARAGPLDSGTSIACARLNIGEAHLALGDAASAIRALEEARSVCAELAEPRLTSGTMVALGSARALAGDVDAGLAMVYEGVGLRRSITSARLLVNDLCYLVGGLLDAGRTKDAAAGARELRELFQAAPGRQMFPTRILAVLARTARASGDLAAAGRFLAEGQTRFDARLDELPDDETRAAFAAQAFNRVFTRRAQEPAPRPSKARA